MSPASQPCCSTSPKHRSPSPDGRVRDVVFPVVGEQTLRDLVREKKATGPSYHTSLRTVIRNSYRGHYRRAVPELLDTLEFRSNNALHRPVIDALDLVRRYARTKLHLAHGREGAARRCRARAVA